MVKKELLLASLLAVLGSGCDTSYEDVRCITADVGACPARTASDFPSDDKYECSERVRSVLEGPVETRDPAITGAEGKRACCYLVEIEVIEGAICTSGRPLRLDGGVRSASLTRQRAWC